LTDTLQAVIIVIVATWWVCVDERRTPVVEVKSDVSVRPLREGDLQEADRIMRLAFGTFLGLPEPMTFMGDASYVRTRW
jgi:hypothetical protein